MLKNAVFQPKCITLMMWELILIPLRSFWTNFYSWYGDIATFSDHSNEVIGNFVPARKVICQKKVGYRIYTNSFHNLTRDTSSLCTMKSQIMNIRTTFQSISVTPFSDQSSESHLTLCLAIC